MRMLAILSMLFCSSFTLADEPCDGQKCCPCEKSTSVVETDCRGETAQVTTTTTCDSKTCCDKVACCESTCGGAKCESQQTVTTSAKCECDPCKCEDCKCGEQQTVAVAAKCECDPCKCEDCKCGEQQSVAVTAKCECDPCKCEDDKCGPQVVKTERPLNVEIEVCSGEATFAKFQLVVNEGGHGTVTISAGGSAKPFPSCGNVNPISAARQILAAVDRSLKCNVNVDRVATISETDTRPLVKVNDSPGCNLKPRRVVQVISNDITPLIEAANSSRHEEEWLLLGTPQSVARGPVTIDDVMRR